MQVQIRARDFRIPDTVCEEMERRICFALSRFVARISLVTVTLTDSNGPRGGVDKQCHLVVRLTPSGKVIIEERHADMSAAVALAADRAGMDGGSGTQAKMGCETQIEGQACRRPTIGVSLTTHMPTANNAARWNREGVCTMAVPCRTAGVA